MNNQEAIENLKFLLSGGCYSDQMEYVEEIEFTSEPLLGQKQTLKQPWKGLGGTFYMCLVCGYLLIKKGDNCCSNCGERLKWEE